MKLQEQLKEIKRLMLEATASSSAGSYEAPLPVDAPEEVGSVISVEVMDDAPEVDVVDITMSDDMEPCPDCGEPECPGCEDEYMDLEDVFNSLNLFTETTIKEQEAVAGMEAETVMGIDRKDVDDLVAKSIEEKTTFSPLFILKKIAGCGKGKGIALNIYGTTGGGTEDMVYPGNKKGTLDIYYQNKKTTTANICGGMDTALKLIPKKVLIKLINNFLKTSSGLTNYNPQDGDKSGTREGKFNYEDVGNGRYQIVKI